MEPYWLGDVDGGTIVGVIDDQIW